MMGTWWERRVGNARLRLLILQAKEISAWRMKASSFSVFLKLLVGEWSPPASLSHVDASVAAAKGYPRNLPLPGGNVPGERTELRFLSTNCVLLLVSCIRAFAPLPGGPKLT